MSEQTTQKKFFRILQERAEAEGLELIVDHEWANRGTLRLQDPNSFEEALSVPFDFQLDIVHFGWMARYRGVPIFTEKPNPYFAGFKPSELGEAIDALLAYDSRFVESGASDATRH